MKDTLKFGLILLAILIIAIIGKVFFDSFNNSFIPKYNNTMEIKLPNFSYRLSETTTSVTYVTLSSAQSVNTFFKNYFDTLTYMVNKTDSSLPGIYYNKENKMIIMGYSITKKGLFTRTYQIIYSTNANLLENYQ